MRKNLSATEKNTKNISCSNTK